MEGILGQINGAAEHSIGGVNVELTSGGSITGQGISATAGALKICGGNLDNILSSFGGDIEGGSDYSDGGSGSGKVLHHTSKLGKEMSHHLDKELTDVLGKASDLESFVSMAREVLPHADSDEVKEVLEVIIEHMHNAAQAIREAVDDKVSPSKKQTDDFLARNEDFVAAVRVLGADVKKSTVAGMMSLSFSSVNDLKSIADKVSEALKLLSMKKSEYLGASMAELDAKLSEKVSAETSEPELKELMKAWSVLMHNHGHRKNDEFKAMVEGGAVVEGGLATNKLVDRLTGSRDELRKTVNRFIDEFAVHVNGLSASTNKMALSIGKDIPYSDATVVFLDTFERLSSTLDSNMGKLYQHLLELNVDQVDSKELKDRFLLLLKDLSERVLEIGSNAELGVFAKHCQSIISVVNKYNDMIKTQRDNVRKEGGSTERMNELFSVDAARIDISGLLNPLENLKVAISKIHFLRNIAMFRSNLQTTNKELAVYSKDYAKSVGKSIGEMITKIKNDYTDIINQISDDKSGMGLEINMYNDTLKAGDKISKEKLKFIYKWQCDARIGLYKTVEAIDMYLLHFTESITKNPDAVMDLHKMLTATKIIAKWYDQKAGDNLIRVFESFRTEADLPTGTEEQKRAFLDVDASDFVQKQYSDSASPYADLRRKIGGDRAKRVYERTRQAMEGIVVLKNIISYFITIGEKYGDFKTEKNIYMAPSNIYKNLVNYIWVSALEVNTSGTEVLDDNNQTKRLITYEDTKVKLAVCGSIDPELFGLNFNATAIDKLRIMKIHREFQHLQSFVGNMDTEGVDRIKQFVSSVFARLGKTEYIFEMLAFGVYNLLQMDDDMIDKFLTYLARKAAISKVKIYIQVQSGGSGIGDLLTETNKDNAANLIKATTLEDRRKIRIYRQSVGPNGTTTTRVFNTLESFQQAGIKDIIMYEGADSSKLYPLQDSADMGFLAGFVSGLTQDKALVSSTNLFKVLHACISAMFNKYNATHTSSVFAIDDTYFILAIKAIAGKIMAVTGVNSLLKRPKNEASTSPMRNQTRLIMGGAGEDVSVIQEAVELYVRLPLLVEFYRNLFDRGNKEYKSDNEMGNLDEERVSFVPEIGNIWSGIIINIFDQSKHIESGIYTTDNMRKIISEVNAIYKHYKGSVPSEQLVRHILLELVSEINRRYGVIKRQELLEYYRTLNAIKRNGSESFQEANYTNNDLDILDESNEFEKKSPSDEFVKYKAELRDPSTPIETKVNRLTDYKILKEFRERIDYMATETDGKLRVNSDPTSKYLTLKDRIRLLKRAISSKSDSADKYDIIAKAILEADSMNQSSNDIFVCFHEFVITPLKTLSKMHESLDIFITNFYALISAGASAGVGGIYNADQILKSETATGNLLADIRTELATGIAKITKNGIMSIGASQNMKYNTTTNTITCDKINGGVDNEISSCIQLTLMKLLLQFSTNSSELIKLNVSASKVITIDFSEFQKVCEYLVSNVKFMISKFIGLVPSSTLDTVSNPSAVGSVYWLENELINKVFNRLNKGEKQQSVKSLDNLNRLMPVVSKMVFDGSINTTSVFSTDIITNNQDTYVFAKNCMPVIRDMFAVYDSSTRAFTYPNAADFSSVSSSLNTAAYDNLKAAGMIEISQLLFNPQPTASISKQNKYGIVQEFNTLISQYLSSLYDNQSRKIYTKAFATFAGSALVDALNGQSFPDFKIIDKETLGFTHNDAPTSQAILSATLAFTMKTLNNRVHPTTGMKIHEITSIEEVSPHMMERYRSAIPMYLRLFKLFVKKCRMYRKMIGHMTFTGNLSIAGVRGIGNDATMVREILGDSPIVFADNITSLNTADANSVQETVGQYIDAIVNSMSSLISDVQSIHTELMETDPTVSLYFDIKKDFTKNYFTDSKELPFAPLSILTSGFKRDINAIKPFYGSDHLDNKYLYGLRSMLSTDFKISTKNIPYMKSIIDTFNGYTVSANQVQVAKFDDTLSHISRAMNYIYDLRFYSGMALNQYDPLDITEAAADRILTYQEYSSKASSMSIVESINVIDSRNKVAEYVKTSFAPSISAAVVPRSADRHFARKRVMMVNIIDLNIMPINVHSLMREIPLANLYNYAMTFDGIVSSLKMPVYQKSILEKPYAKFAIAADGSSVDVGSLNVSLDIIRGPDDDSSLRFVKDILINKVTKSEAALPLTSISRVNQRMDTKLYHNLMFLTLTQAAIKEKVRTELDFINTRVVSSTNAVSDVVTNLTPNNMIGEVSDALFEF